MHWPQIEELKELLRKAANGETIAFPTENADQHEEKLKEFLIQYTVCRLSLAK